MSMSADSYQDLSRAIRRRIILGAVLRGFLSTTALVVLYYFLPLDQRFGTEVAVRVLIGLVVFVAITVWQVRSIIGSPYPGMKAFEALGLLFPFYLLMFASTYFVMERTSAASFTEPLTRTDALYFSVTVFSTVGFGDIAPKSEAARIVLIVQMLGDIALLGAGVRVLLGAVRRGQQRRSDTDDDGPGSAGGP
jgi:voltage-gated potassium channel